MKLLKYQTYPDVKLEVEEYTGQPYLKYEECSSGLRLEVTVDDSLIDDVKETLKGDLPDSVLSVLGIDVSGEDLEELCNELLDRGIPCELSSSEDEEYCERVYIKLGAPSNKLVKVVVEGNDVRIYPTSSKKSYLKYTSGRVKRVEAIVPVSVLSALENAEDKIKSLVTSLIPKLADVNLDDPVELVEALEDEENYRLCIERRGNVLEWSLE